jgi:ribose transport system ATP-binding protein/rhamnose transport system ATP-binding protein
MLVVRDLTKSFGRVEALRGVSLSLAAGEIQAVCGENGAGKSTLMKLLMGIFQPDAGAIEIDGRPAAIGGPQHAQRLGLALVAQELSLAPALSVLDNIWLGDAGVPLFHRRARLREKAAAALAELGVEYDLDRPVGGLSMGERQIVEIARLLARDARILILDEPTATLSDIEIERMMEALRRLKAKGRSILYVTHRLGEVFAVCDTVSVLRNGRGVAYGKVAGTSREQLIEQMLGRTFEKMYPDPGSGAASREALVVEGLDVPGAVSGFSVVAERGRITCIAGQVGAGASLVTRAIAGLVPGATARVALDGVPLPLGSVARGKARGIVFVSEDRAGEGIFRRSVLENVVAARIPDNTRGGILSWASLRRLGAELCRRVTVDRSRLGASAFELSGGNQQKLLFARALGDGRPGVLLINEPTRGVDVGARVEIYRLLREFCGLGYAILMTSSDLEEVVGMSDAVVTMYRGSIVSRYDRGQIGMSAILADITHPAGPARLAS